MAGTSPANSIQLQLQLDQSEIFAAKFAWFSMRICSILATDAWNLSATLEIIQCNIWKGFCNEQKSPQFKYQTLSLHQLVLWSVHYTDAAEVM